MSQGLIRMEGSKMAGNGNQNKMTTEECRLLMNLSLATNKDEALEAIKKLYLDKTPKELQRILNNWLKEP